MKIIDVIKILNDTYDDFYLEYKPSLLYPSSELCFNNGYCYEYHRMLKIFYPKAILVMQNDRMHCATLIDGEIYDVNGKREDYFNFHEATGADIEYIYKYYGFFSDWVKESLNNMIRNNVYKEKNKVKVLVKIN